MLQKMGGNLHTLHMGIPKLLNQNSIIIWVLTLIGDEEVEKGYKWLSDIYLKSVFYI